MAKIPTNWFKYDWPLKDSQPQPSQADYSKENVAQLVRSFGYLLGIDPARIVLHYENNTHNNKTDDIYVGWVGSAPPCDSLSRPFPPNSAIARYERAAKKSKRLKLFQDNSPAKIKYFQPYDICRAFNPKTLL